MNPLEILKNTVMRLLASLAVVPQPVAPASLSQKVLTVAKPPTSQGRLINATAYKLVQFYEQLSLIAYDDAAPNKVLEAGDHIIGTLTNGWGHTGKDVYIGQVLTRPAADYLLDSDLTGSEVTVDHFINSFGVSLTDNQFSALVSAVFNIGGSLLGDTKIARALKADNLIQVPALLEEWDHDATGEELLGLKRRRIDEGALFTCVAGDPASFKGRIV